MQNGVKLMQIFTSRSSVLPKPTEGHYW